MPAKKLHVGYVSAEVAPFAKTGGLADTAAALPKALARAASGRVSAPDPAPISRKC